MFGQVRNSKEIPALVDVLGTCRWDKAIECVTCESCLLALSSKERDFSRTIWGGRTDNKGKRRRSEW
jgi:hypothetical protein